jgi:hypothetical protein
LLYSIIMSRFPSSLRSKKDVSWMIPFAISLGLIRLGPFVTSNFLKDYTSEGSCLSWKRSYLLKLFPAPEYSTLLRMSGKISLPFLAVVIKSGYPSSEKSPARKITLVSSLGAIRSALLIFFCELNLTGKLN